MKKTGFTLLFASLIVSLLLAIGIAILNITLEQLLLSSTAKESQFAFYNADTGIECALYYDKNNSNPTGKGFATSTLSTNYITQTDADNGNFMCNGVKASNVTLVGANSSNVSAETDFDLLFTSPECTNLSQGGLAPLIHVAVVKTVDSLGNVNTVVNSYGYNSCDPTSPRRVERGFQTFY